MRRSVIVSLDFATKSKRKQISNLLTAYRVAVNFYIRHLWKYRGSMDKATLALLQNTTLSERYKSNALKQALEMVISTKKSAKALGVKASRPVFKGSAILDAKFVSVEDGEGSFDLVVRLSTLRKQRKITIPTKHTKMSRKWLGVVNSKLIQGCCLTDNKLTLFIEIPELLMKTKGKTLGLDMGVHKMIADSDGNFYGIDYSPLLKKLRRTRKGSKARKRAYKERDNYIGRVVNSIPWDAVHTVGVEELKDIKKGKSPKRSKAFRKAMAPWVVRQVISRIENKASENRVRLVKVDPAYTSQTCPVCRTVHSENRKGEKYLCSTCGYAGDSDTVGAHNILVRTCGSVGSLESPMHKKKIRFESYSI